MPEAIKMHGLALQYASLDLRQNPEFIIAALKINYTTCYKYYKNLQNKNIDISADLEK